MGRLRQRLRDCVEDAVRLERLDDEVLRAALDRLEHLRLLAEGRAHDDLGGGIEREDVLEGGEAVLLGHGDVERREVGTQLLELRERLDAVAGFADDLVAATDERVGDHLPHERSVVDDEHTCHYSSPSVATAIALGGVMCSMRTAHSPSSASMRR